MTMPPNTLLHTFSLYNAIVILDDDKTRLHWNNTLGFSIDEESLNWPIVDISNMPNILAEAKKARDNFQIVTNEKIKTMSKNQSPINIDNALVNISGRGLPKFLRDAGILSIIDGKFTVDGDGVPTMQQQVLVHNFLDSEIGGNSQIDETGHKLTTDPNTHTK